METQQVAGVRAFYCEIKVKLQFFFMFFHVFPGFPMFFPCFFHVFPQVFHQVFPCFGALSRALSRGTNGSKCFAALVKGMEQAPMKWLV